MGHRRAPHLAVAAAVLALATRAGATPLGVALDRLAADHDARAGGLPAVSGGEPVPAYSAWAALAVMAAGEDPASWGRGRRSLAAAARRLPDRPALGDVERALVVAGALDGPGPSPPGSPAVAALVSAQRPDGTIGASAHETGWGILALRSAGLPAGAAPIRRAAAALAAGRRAGGWALPGGPPDAVTTATAIQALRAAGRPPTAPELVAARSDLARYQRADGGFGAFAGRRATIVTTAWVALALRGMGERLDGRRWGRRGGPLAYLRRAQAPDGSPRPVARPGGAPTLATALSALAFAGRPLVSLGRGPRRTVDHAPRLAARAPAAGGTVGERLVVRYRDDADGGGVDPAAVRLRIDGRDVTRRARITPLSLILPGALVGPGAHVVELGLADRAGNGRSLSWRVRGGGR